MKFVKVGQPVDAVQFSGNTGELPYEFGVTILRSKGSSCYLSVDNIETECRAGDWIIREPLTDHGHKLYPVAAEDFGSLYLPAPGQHQA